LKKEGFIVKKTRVLILFGGRSTEHEVSLCSARNVLLALDRERFEPLLVGIDKQGCWRIEPEQTLLNAKGDPRLLRLLAQGDALPVPVYPQPQAPVDLTAPDRSLLTGDDVVFPVLHGTYGEDGTVQGLLELADVAYVGPGHLGSAIGMDKDVTKRLLDQAGIPVVPWRVITTHDMRRNESACLQKAAELGFPVFVKPANAGSSVGVNKVEKPTQLALALQSAFAFDTKVLVEAAIDAREIECAVLGNDEPQASVPAEILVHHKDGFYSYDAKYVDADGSEAIIPANLPPALIKRVQTLAIETFRTLELFGMSRVDFFLDRSHDMLYVNEVNTIPGFTTVSMYPKMWEASGIPVKDLVSRLIDLAIERRIARRALKTAI
jgi:D-alanine-D-alanine ligase